MTGPQPKPCGTQAAYESHRRNSETTCPACRAANAARVRNQTGHLSRRDIDEIAVARATAGDPPARMTIAERAEAVRRLHQRHLSDPGIAGVLGISTMTVLRIRQRLDLPAVPPERRAVA